MVRMNPYFTVIALPFRHRQEKVTNIVFSVKGIIDFDIILYVNGKNQLAFPISFYTDLRNVRIESFCTERSFCCCRLLRYSWVITG